MSKEKSVKLPFPVKGILLGFPPVGDLIRQYMPQLYDREMVAGLPEDTDLYDLKELCGISDEAFGQLVEELDAWNKAFRALMEKETAEFGVEVDLDAPCHQWSNTDEKIQEACVREIEEKYAGRKGEIIFYGPSNLQMWYSLEQDMLPFAAQNHGMGGCVDEEMIKYADRMMYAFEPYAVFFQTGSNDLANGFTLEQILKNKKYMYGEYLKNMPNTKLIVMSGLPLPNRQQFWEDTVKTNELLREMCANTDRMYFMDATDVMLADEGPENMRTYDGRYFRPEYYRSDGIHLNKVGHDAWTAKMKEILKEII